MLNQQIAKALNAIRPNSSWVIEGDDYSGLNWLPENTQPKPTEAEVAAEIARQEQQAPIDACKSKAKELLVASDWSALPDVKLSNQADFIAYRAAVRALAINPVADPSWPVEPAPVWSE